MSFLRYVLMLAVVLGACFLSHQYSEHHSANNEKAFEGCTCTSCRRR
ncbi:MAG: hypothetical protein R3F17_05075 [Planctomycetota bacterium]